MITRAPIQVTEEIGRLQSQEAGAWVWFAGTVRGISHGQKVSYLEYEAFESLAEKMIREITSRVAQKFHLLQASCIHRIGRVDIGETAVLVVTAAAHRDAAYLANMHIIDAVKQNVPIWKKEYWTDGSFSWGGCMCQPAMEQKEKK